MCTTARGLILWYMTYKYWCLATWTEWQVPWHCILMPGWLALNEQKPENWPSCSNSTVVVAWSATRRLPRDRNVDRRLIGTAPIEVSDHVWRVVDHAMPQTENDTNHNHDRNLEGVRRKYFGRKVILEQHDEDVVTVRTALYQPCSFRIVSCHAARHPSVLPWLFSVVLAWRWSAEKTPVLRTRDSSGRSWWLCLSMLNWKRNWKSSKWLQLYQEICSFHRTIWPVRQPLSFLLNFVILIIVSHFESIRISHKIGLREPLKNLCRCHAMAEILFVYISLVYSPF